MQSGSKAPRGILSRGAVALKRASSGRQAEVAKQIGVHQGTISYLVRGKGIPSFRTALLLQEELGIPTHWWAEDPSSSAPRMAG